MMEIDTGPDEKVLTFASDERPRGGRSGEVARRTVARDKKYYSQRGNAMRV
jgi:hypothetical protein